MEGPTPLDYLLLRGDLLLLSFLLLVDLLLLSAFFRRFFLSSSESESKKNLLIFNNQIGNINLKLDLNILYSALLSCQKLFRKFTQIKLVYSRIFNRRSGAGRLLPAWHSPNGRARLQAWLTAAGRRSRRAGPGRKLKTFWLVNLRNIGEIQNGNGTSYICAHGLKRI